jgi:hypothetical protein
VARRDWPIVIGGCHRSGTSLVRRMLDTHPRIHCGPEVLFFRDFYGDYRDDRFARLRFAATARSLLPEDDLLDVLGRGFVSLHERAAQQAGKPRWADKAPENVLYGAQWERLLGDGWLMVQVVRNPLDTIASMRESPFPLTLPQDLPGRIAYYLRFTEAGLRFEAKYPDRHRRVVYEELCTSPKDALERLMAWLGEEFLPAQLDFNAIPHQAGQEDPEIAATSGVHAESLGRWRSILTDEEVAEVWSATQQTWSLIDPEYRYVSPPAEAPAGSP